MSVHNILSVHVRFVWSKLSCLSLLIVCVTLLIILLYTGEQQQCWHVHSISVGVTVYVDLMHQKRTYIPCTSHNIFIAVRFNPLPRV
jgi:hypothetical protein